MMRRSFGCVVFMTALLGVVTFQGDIGCDDELTVYADGTEVASETAWNRVSHITLSETPTVIAAKCVNTGGPGGLVGSFDGGLVTDTTWRCSDTESAGWTEASFDDSGWNFAALSTYPPPRHPYGVVSSSAKFIWNNAESVGTTYCRRPSGPVVTFQGDMGCDDELTVYADGTEVASETAWNRVSHITLAETPTVIAAKCVNTGGPGGLVGSFDGGLVTDTTWRCSDTKSAGWTKASFDDSDWAFAALSTYPPPRHPYEVVSSSAKFIWSDAESSRTTFCRLQLLEPDDSSEVTPEGCKSRSGVHPPGESWIEEMHTEPLRQKECACPDPLPVTWNTNSPYCTAACVMDDGVIHYGEEAYQRTVDGTTLDCKCNSHGRERCKPKTA